jgi:hypothetical protein
MKAKRTAKDGLGIVGFGAAACVACCAGPVLAFLGGVSVAGIASTWFIGIGGLLIAAVAALAFIVVRRRRQQSACATDPAEPVPVQLLTDADRRPATPSRSAQ